MEFGVFDHIDRSGQNLRDFYENPSQTHRSL